MRTYLLVRLRFNYVLTIAFQSAICSANVRTNALGSDMSVNV